MGHFTLGGSFFKNQDQPHFSMIRLAFYFFTFQALFDDRGEGFLIKAHFYQVHDNPSKSSVTLF